MWWKRPDNVIQFPKKNIRHSAVPKESINNLVKETQEKAAKKAAEHMARNQIKYRNQILKELPYGDKEKIMSAAKKVAEPAARTFVQNAYSMFIQDWKSMKEMRILIPQVLKSIPSYMDDIIRILWWSAIKSFWTDFFIPLWPLCASRNSIMQPLCKKIFDDPLEQKFLYTFINLLKTKEQLAKLNTNTNSELST